MDSSDIGPLGQPWDSCTPDHMIPEVVVTVNGTSETLDDTNKVLNTGGIDKASCPKTTDSPDPNESHSWVQLTTTNAPKISTGIGGSSGGVSVNTPNTNCGDPVECASGDFWDTYRDVSVPGYGPALDLTRTYNSLLASDNSIFGYGWSCSYCIHLVPNSGGSVTFVAANGSQVTATPNGSGGYTLPSFTDSTLTYSNGQFTYDYMQDKFYQFNSSGTLTSISDLNGDTTKLTYNSGSQLIKVTNPAGSSLTFTYGSNGDVSSVKDPMGRVTSYTYDSSGNLTAVKDPMGRVTSFGYSTGHLLTSITAPNAQTGGPDAGKSTINTYDSTGRLLTQTDPLGRVLTFSYTGDNYSSAGGTTTITDPNGNAEVETYINGQLQTVEKGGDVWGYTFDQSNFATTSETDPNGNINLATYDVAGNMLSSTNALGNTTTYAYDSLNDMTCMALPEATTPCSELNPPATIPAGTPIISPPSSIPPPFVTYSQYDSNGNLIWTTTGVYPPGSTTPLYAKTSYNLYNGESVTLNGVTDSCDTPAPSSSLACATINPDGVVTQITYNQDGDAIKLSSPDTKLITSSSSGTSSPSSSGELSVITSTYDADGELTSVVSPDGNVSGANKANYTTTYTYDADGELTQKVQGSSSANITPRVTKYSYDENGNNTSISSSMSPHFVGADSAITISSTTSKPNINLSLPAGSSSGDEQVLTVTATAPAKSVVPSLSSGDITTYVGNGSYGSSGMGGQATSAPLNGPYSVAATSNGNLALADRNNSVIDFVPAQSGTYFGQQMTAGDIYRIAGNGTFGDAGLGGPATSAQLNGPGAVAFDGAGNLYISNTGKKCGSFP